MLDRCVWREIQPFSPSSAPRSDSVGRGAEILDEAGDPNTAKKMWVKLEKQFRHAVFNLGSDSSCRGEFPWKPVINKG